jgi:hypothetical protein
MLAGAEDASHRLVQAGSRAVRRHAIAMNLGIRRAGVTESLGRLQEARHDRNPPCHVRARRPPGDGMRGYIDSDRLKWAPW